ncbi:MAG: protocatechuate 3,4-dioxygenase subunit alpha [Actinomycetota bacterium]|nr:protocatechuate 3,4-dioxygenase subunit alpha [Actinomycetota bacterium]
MTLSRTPSQTVGPFFEFGLVTKTMLVEANAPGAIRVEGRVLDGAGEPVSDGLVEIWQADADGRYEGSFGWGRCQTDLEGGYAFTTVKPGAVREPDGTVQAPHVTVLCFARGLLKPVLTRLYFSDEADANAADPLFGAIGDDGDRATLVATETGPATYRFDIQLQGDGQTVFFTTPASGL